MKLLGVEQHGALLEKHWQHIGEDGRKKITVETIQDVAPVFKGVKERAQAPKSKEMRYIGEVPQVLVDDFCYRYAHLWGIRPRQVLKELMEAKTDRAKKVWKMLTTSRDYRKLQAKHYA